jgi:AcrR family transcriptional regulator
MVDGNEKRKQKKIAQIMTAATTLFIQNGIKSTSIADIAKAANVSQVTLYKYFESKERLGEEVALSIYTQSMQGFSALFADTSIPFPKQLQELLIRDMAMDSSINEEFYAFMLNAFQSLPKDSPVALAYAELQDDFWGNLIQRGRDTGYLNERITDAAIRMYIDMFIQYAQNTSNSPDDMGSAFQGLTEELIELFFFGMLKTDPSLHDEVMSYLNEA